MNKIKLLIIICFGILHSDEVTSSCKDYKHKECLDNRWKFENKESSFIKSYENIVKEIGIISKVQLLKQGDI